MMTKDLLVELGLEELPAYVVTPSEKQLVQRMADFLKANRLSYDAIEGFSTPRRLAVRVLGLADQQTDLTEDFKGPSKKIRSEEHTSELQSRQYLVCRLLLEKKNIYLP